MRAPPNNVIIAAMPDKSAEMSPDDLTADQRKVLLRHIKRGTPTQDACNIIGLSYTLFKKWFAIAEPDPVIERFQQEVRKADSEGVARLVDTLWGLDENDQEFSAEQAPDKIIIETHRFLLAKRRREEYGEPKNVPADKTTNNILINRIEGGLKTGVLDVLKDAGIAIPQEILLQMEDRR